MGQGARRPVLGGVTLEGDFVVEPREGLLVEACFFYGSWLVSGKNIALHPFRWLYYKKVVVLVKESKWNRLIGGFLRQRGTNEASAGVRETDAGGTVISIGMEIEMVKILAIYGSPRRKGNTSLLLKKAVEGATEAGSEVEELVLRDLKMSPCLEIYGCKESGRCVINDDFQTVYDKLLACQGLMLASPIFFYTVSAHTKILMDRCQSLWVKRHWVENAPVEERRLTRKGLFISAGATKGKRLFDGTLLSIRYFFDVLDMELSQSLLYRSLDFEGDVVKHPEYLEEAYQAGKELVEAMKSAS
jgi:multimeric flavodoxin WrbA